jgi:hypothetical protein
VEYPYIRNIYKLFGAEKNVESAHLPKEQHDYGYNKRIPMYQFMAKHLRLNIQSITNSYGIIDESFVGLLEKLSLQVFPDKNYPEGTVTDCNEVIKLMNTNK